MSDFIFDGKSRTDLGKGASRRLRRQGLIPAVIYGANADAASLTLNHNEVLKCFRHDDVYSSIVTVTIDGKKESAILRDVQRHPFKPLITHLDFMRVRADEALTVSVPLHLLNAEDAKGVKLAAGVVSQILMTINISCLPKNLPNVIELDIADLDVGETLTIGDIKAISGVTFLHEADEAVIAILHPRTEEAATDNADSETDAEAASEGDSEE